MTGLRHLGPTQQRMLRHLLASPGGSDVETMCARLRVSHNAVRQHLTALMAKGFIERSQPWATGGRPRARFCLTSLGHEQFPRNYARISAAMLDGIIDRIGKDGTTEMLVELGRKLGAEAQEMPAESTEVAAANLAERMDRLGYEAVRTKFNGEHEIEAFNCVFHSIAKHNPCVCKFDIAFMEAASGHRIHHMECIVRGGNVCRFRLGSRLESSSPIRGEDGRTGPQR